MQYWVGVHLEGELAMGRGVTRHEWMGRDKRNLGGETEPLSPSGSLLYLREVGGRSSAENEVPECMGLGKVTGVWSRHFRRWLGGAIQPQQAQPQGDGLDLQGTLGTILEFPIRTQQIKSDTGEKDEKGVKNHSCRKHQGGGCQEKAWSRAAEAGCTLLCWEPRAECHPGESSQVPGVGSSFGIFFTAPQGSAHLVGHKEMHFNTPEF